MGGYNYSLCILSGVLSSSLFALVIITSLEPVRRRLFEWFYYAHLLALPATVAAILHCPKSLWLVLFALLSWVADKALRAFKVRHEFSVKEMKLLPGDVACVEVSVENTFLDGFKPGQYAFLRFPSVSMLEWHPLTIASAPESRCARFLIKSFGESTWSGKVPLPRFPFLYLCSDASFPMQWESQRE